MHYNKMISYIVLLFLLLILKVAGAIYQTDCSPLVLSEDRILCVCNATYCDTIPPVQRLKPMRYVKYTSSESGLRFKKDIGHFKLTTVVSPNATVIKLHSKKTFQKIIGFGGAFTDAAGININSLNAEAKNKLLRSYFSDEGIEYNLGRVPIAGTDMSIRSYTYDDGPEDVMLLNFKLQPEDYFLKIPLIREARRLTGNKLLLFSAAWHAPQWMYGTSNKEINYIRPSMYAVWANYHLKFLQSYRTEGVHFWGISTGNEPITTALFNLSYTVWKADQLGTWLGENLGPTIRSSKFSGINILTYGDMRPFLLEYVGDMFKANPMVETYTDGIAVHWYLDNISSPDVLEIAHRKYPHKFILSTEACVMDTAHGLWSFGEMYLVDIIQDLKKRAVGWVDWNIALDWTGGPSYANSHLGAPIIVNARAGEFYKEPMFYAMGHVSKFIPKGSVVVDHTQSDDKVQVLAVKRPDRGIAVVILNSNSHNILLHLIDRRRGIIKTEIMPKSFTTILYW